MNLNRVDADIKFAKYGLSPETNPTNDEYCYDLAGYHIQQAIEKCLKYRLHDVYGMDDNAREYKTHNIATLLLMLTSKDNGEYLRNHPELIRIADMVTKWEASSRYGESIVSVRKDLTNALAIAEQMYQEVLEIEQSRNEEITLEESEEYESDLEER